jgi:hypothetical protein
VSWRGNPRSLRAWPSSGGLTRSKTGVGTRLAGHAKQAVDLRAAGGPPAGASPGRLTQARRLSSAETLTIPDRAAIVTRLYGYERQWIVALAAIQAFTRE